MFGCVIYVVLFFTGCFFILPWFILVAIWCFDACTIPATVALCNAKEAAGGQQTVVVTQAAPQPVYAAPQPVYAAPQPVYVQPQPVYAAPQPVYVQPAYQQQ